MTEILSLIGRLFGLLTIPLMMFIVWGLIQQTRREQPITRLSLIIGLMMAPLTLTINVVFLRQALQAFLGSALLLFGVAFGLAWGQTARLSARGDRIVARRSTLHLVFWLVSYAITQVLSTFAPAYVVAGGLAAMFFSTGATLGTNSNMLVRRARVRPPLDFTAMPTFLPETRGSLPPSLPSRPTKNLLELAGKERDSRPADLPR